MARSIALLGGLPIGFLLLSPKQALGCGAFALSGSDESCIPSSHGFSVQYATPPTPKGWDPPSQSNWWVPVLHTSVLFAGMRLTEAWLWPEPFAETRPHIWLKHYREAFTRSPKWDATRPPFEWDGDRWQINVIGHGLLGAELYGRARWCGNGIWASLGFATVASAAWEYLVEANGVRPSGMDLWFTPLSGVLLGEARFWLSRSASSWNNGFGSVVQLISDPFGEFERGIGAPC